MTSDPRSMSPIVDALARRYRNLEKIGEGAMGEVWRGTDPRLEREVAIKLMRDELATRPEAVERFRAEAVSLARLSHANIVPLHDFVQEGRHSWMVLEFVRGHSLDRVLARQARLPWREACMLIGQALAGLERAHAAGIVHRDIKPANMMLSDDGTLKLMDFGIARISRTARLTRVGHAVGTVAYMAPEQIHGREADERSDLYAVGVVLFELLTGSLPFGGRTEAEIIRHHVERATLPDVRTQVPGVPAPLASVVAKALNRDPAGRFATAAMFAQSLAQVLAAASRDASAPSRRTPRWPLMPTVAVLAVVVGSAAGWSAWRTPTRSAAPDASVAGVRAAPAAGASVPIEVKPPQQVAPAASDHARAPVRETTSAQVGPSSEVIERAEQTCRQQVARARALLEQRAFGEAGRVATQALREYSACVQAQEVVDLAIAAATAEAAKEPTVPVPPQRESRVERKVKPPPQPLPSNTPTPAAPPIPAQAAREGNEAACSRYVSDGWAAFRRDKFAEASELARKALDSGGCEGAQRLRDIAMQAR